LLLLLVGAWSAATAAAVAFELAGVLPVDEAVDGDDDDDVVLLPAEDVVGEADVVAAEAVDAVVPDVGCAEDNDEVCVTAMPAGSLMLK
jgi:hypothetical protein